MDPVLGAWEGNLIVGPTEPYFAPYPVPSPPGPQEKLWVFMCSMGCLVLASSFCRHEQRTSRTMSAMQCLED